MRDMGGHEGLGLAAACGGRLAGVSTRKRKRRVLASGINRSRFLVLVPAS